jgi:transposase-like protein
MRLIKSYTSLIDAVFIANRIVENIITFDVIPMDETLIMIGDEILYQYRYLDNDIELISSMNLN